MANKIFKDTETGDIYERIVSSGDTAGEYTSIKVLINPGGFKPVLHYHKVQDEIFEVISGKLTYILDGKKGVIPAGEKITLPKGIPHTHYNDEQVPLEMIHTVTPSLDFDYFSDTIFGLASEGKLRKGSPGLLQVLVLFRSLQSKTLLASIPYGIQAALSYILAPVARLAGKKAVYKRFSGVEI